MAPVPKTRNMPEELIRSEPDRYFDSLHQSFQRATDRTQEIIDRCYNIAGETIRLRFAGPALVPHLTPALAHLDTTEIEQPSLTICIWDYASTGILPSEWLPFGAMPRGDIPGFGGERFQAHIGADYFSALDGERKLAIYWCEDAATLPLYEKGAPLRSILHWWFRRSNLQLVHAGAVGTADGGVLLAGKGGSGKSTTSLVCINSNLFYASDDYSLIALEPAPTAHTLYNTAKVRADNLHRVPFLENKIYNAEQLHSEKALFFLHEHFPQKLIASLPIRAILLPRVSGRTDTSLAKASSRESLSALLPSTMHQLAGANKQTVGMVKQLADILPAFHLELGSDLDQIPVIINKLLR